MSTKKSIESSVGKNARNRKNDSILVQERLNVYIEQGPLNHLQPIPVTGKGGDEATVDAIKEFQSHVLSVEATGKIRGNGDQTFRSLLMTPKSSDAYHYVHAMIANCIKKGPKPGIQRPAWEAAMDSLRKHMRHPRLKRYSMMSLVDFTLGKKDARLWVIDLYDFEVKINTLVAHGRGPNEKAARNSLWPTALNHGAYVSKTGAFITRGRGRTSAGQKDRSSGAKGPGVWLEGVDTTNRDTYRRGIIFHGAHYVTNTHAGCSRGCFATKWSDNDYIVEQIRDGSFVYAWAGEKHKPMI